MHPLKIGLWLGLLLLATWIVFLLASPFSPPKQAAGEKETATAENAATDGRAVESFSTNISTAAGDFLPVESQSPDTVQLNEEIESLQLLIAQKEAGEDGFDPRSMDAWARHLQEIYRSGDNPAELHLLAAIFLPAYATTHGEMALQKSMEWFPAGAERDHVLSQVLPALGWESRHHIEALLPAMSSPQASVDLLFQAGLEFFGEAGEEVFPWGADFASQDPNYTAFSAGAITALATANPARATELFAIHVPDSPPREALPVWMDVVETLAFRLGQTDAAAAEQWAEEIRDPALRSLATFTLFAESLEKSRDAETPASDPR